MNIKKFGVILGISTMLVLTGCQSTDVTPSEITDAEQVENTETEAEAEPEVDYSQGFDYSKQALDAYMLAIINKEYNLAYEMLHQIDKDTFTVDEFVAYQASMQMAKDAHGYGIHEEQTFWDFEFAGVKFEQVDFFDLDYAYVGVNDELQEADNGDDHGHTENSDYITHDHGHEMATIGVATVSRNGRWYVLQGQTGYELKDLTRKYTNQSIALNMEDKDEYLLGEPAPIGNMIVSIQSVERRESDNTYLLDVMFMNTGFDPLDTNNFINKFAVIDDNLKNYLSQSSFGPDGLNGLVRAGSYLRGVVEIPVSESFETDSIYFLMNTIDPERQPVKFNVKPTADQNALALYDSMKRKDNFTVDSKAYIDGFMLTASNVRYVEATDELVAPEGWKVMAFDLELNNLTDEIVYTNQLDLTVRDTFGYAKSLQEQIALDKFEGVTSYTDSFMVLVKEDSKMNEITLCIRDTRPNNSVTIEIEQ